LRSGTSATGFSPMRVKLFSVSWLFKMAHFAGRSSQKPNLQLFEYPRVRPDEGNLRFKGSSALSVQVERQNCGDVIESTAVTVSWPGFGETVSRVLGKDAPSQSISITCGAWEGASLHRKCGRSLKSVLPHIWCKLFLLAKKAGKFASIRSN
jgi:hypothetical protein